ncbi:hypothetical protein EI067_29605 [Mycobacterium paragordonae]|nr:MULTISPECIES: hypothetical protein [Mycobacterium]MDP7732706.1 hypothetical protein [Mycobacterium sp. TY813]TDK86599.1 hypothetical protein EI067_29605 [Mycobacterium paragordonae]
MSSVDENGTQRITLLDADDSVLCGAYKPPGHTHWRLYMSAALARVGAPAALMPATHLLTARREDACQWLELIGHLYAHPAEARIPRPDCH